MHIACKLPIKITEEEEEEEDSSQFNQPHCANVMEAVTSRWKFRQPQRNTQVIEQKAIMWFLKTACLNALHWSLWEIYVSCVCVCLFVNDRQHFYVLYLASWLLFKFQVEQGNGKLMRNTDRDKTTQPLSHQESQL